MKKYLKDKQPSEISSNTVWGKEKQSVSSKRLLIPLSISAKEALKRVKQFHKAKTVKKYGEIKKKFVKENFSGEKQKQKDSKHTGEFWKDLKMKKGEGTAFVFPQAKKSLKKVRYFQIVGCPKQREK